MIAATYTQGDGFRVQEVAPPSVGNGDVLVRVTASAICGTDIRTIRNGHRKLAPGQRITLGHDFALTEMALAFEQAMGQDAMKVVLRTEADGAEAADA